MKKIAIIIAVLGILLIQLLVHKGIFLPSPSINLFFFQIHWYALFIILGAASLIFIFERIRERENIFKEIIIEDLLFYAVIPGIIFARVWHVITDFHLYQNDFIKAFFIWEGGLSIFGAIIGVLIGILIYSRQKKIDGFKLINIVSIGLPFAQIIGRYGNLFNRELYGPPTDRPWGLFVPESWPGRPIEFQNQTSFHPAYLYEQVGNLILFLINIFLFKKFGLKYNFVANWLIGYGIIRFLVEFVRIENRIVGPLSFSQIVCIIMVVVGLAMLIYNLIQKKYVNK